MAGCMLSWGQKDYRKNKLKYTYKNILSRCNNPKATKYKYYGGKGIRCYLSLQELECLWLRDKAGKMKKPSIDRKLSDCHYTFKNCRFVEHGVNVAEANRRTKSKIVYQYTRDSQVFVHKWNSTREIERDLGFKHSNISACCLGKQKTAYGFIWLYF